MTDEFPQLPNRGKELVVVGASAGGIEALSEFVAGLPNDLSIPVVIAQHLSPHRKSSLDAILQGRASLPVVSVDSTEKLRGGTIYVVPSNRDVLITDHEVSVVDRGTSTGTPSVNLLFQSAADVFRENLIAIILSGTGSDGAAGAQEVKNAGGTVIIQDPETAAFPGMPRSLPAVIVDLVADPKQMGSLITSLIGDGPAPRWQEQDAEIRAFLAELRDQEGLDFTNYKQPTIRRRLQRRMTATGRHGLGDYIAYARANSDERQVLVKSFLINVTEFFRDAELFEYLEQQIIPELVSNAQERDTELRVWSAGCSTGEEAYSLAITIAESLRASGARVNVRIFATDLDGEAIAFARKGIFSARSLAKVPASIVDRYFIKRDGFFEVTKELRAMLVFGEHGLGQRAPFPRIDLVVCRNVLIYFTAALQQHALQLFAYSLRPGGYLVVGKSESTGPLANYFTLDNSRFRVFRRQGNQAALPLGMKEVASLSWVPASNSHRNSSLAAHTARRTGGQVATGGRMRGKLEEMMQRLAIGVVVFDEHYDIQMINAAARRSFGIHSPAVGTDFLHGVTTYDVAPLRLAIDRVLQGGESELLLLDERGAIRPNGRTLQITITALTSPKADDPMLVMLQADDVSERERALRIEASTGAMVDRITASNDEILRANLDLTSAIATLRAENEELLVATEEIQAATEEMETLNEELHATNEELETLNEELLATAEELNTANDDLQTRAVEFQELAHANEEGRLKLESILFETERPVVVVSSNGRPIFRNEAFLDRFDLDTSRLRAVEGDGKTMSVKEWLVVLSNTELPFELSFIEAGDQSSQKRVVATGRGDIVAGEDKSFMVIEIDPTAIGD